VLRPLIGTVGPGLVPAAAQLGQVHVATPRRGSGHTGCRCWCAPCPSCDPS